MIAVFLTLRVPTAKSLLWLRERSSSTMKGEVLFPADGHLCVYSPVSFVDGTLAVCVFCGFQNINKVVAADFGSQQHFF